jgi:transposase
VDSDARIARMKDGTTHLAYTAENVVDMDSSLILAGEVYAADQTDSATLEESVHATSDPSRIGFGGCEDSRTGCQ